MEKLFTISMSILFAIGGITLFLFDEYTGLAVFLIACAVFFPVIGEGVL